MTTAIFGLVGVVVGALLSGGMEWWLARRRESLAARTAARLVRDELYLVACWVEDAMQDRWSLPPDWQYDAETWQAQRAFLAVTLPYEQYARAQRAHQAAVRFSAWQQQARDQATHSDSDRRQVQIWLGDLRDGLQTLLDVAR